MIPVLQALILAERIYTTQEGQRIIVGTFNQVTIGDLSPVVGEVTDGKGNQRTLIRGGQPGSPYAYISLTDVCDGTKLDLQFVSLSKNRVIFEQTINITSVDRLQTVEIVSPLPPLPIKEVGIYAFEVICEGEVIGSHRIVAKT